MAAGWAKNETTAALRRCDLLIRYLSASGVLTPAPPGTDFVTAGAVFIRSGAAAVLATGTLTNVRRPLVNADDTFTAANATDKFTATAHGLETGDGPFVVSSSTTLPDGLTAATDYWIIKIDADTFQLATSLANAYAGTEVTIDDDGTGTHTISDTDDTERGIWGWFIYEATQSETDVDTSEIAVVVDGQVDSLDFRMMNTAGAYTTVNIQAPADTAFDQTGEGSNSYGDLIRGIARTMLAKFSKSGNDFTWRDLADSKDSHSGTVTSAGRTAATLTDLT